MRREATGRLAYEIIRALGAPIGPNAANNLFMAVATDTGWFRHQNTTPATFALCGELVALGANPTVLYEQLYEAASLDGANAWRQFWSVTVPLLRPVTAITLLLGFVYTLKVVDIIWIMTLGTGSSQTLATWAYAMAFGKGASSVIRYSQASVVGTILLLVALAMGFVYLAVQRRQED